VIEHRIHPDLLAHRPNVHLVGCGGNGSQMLTGLARLHHAISALGHPGLQVYAWDPDEVSRANVGRQLFSPADVGQNKACVLVHRLNVYYGLAWDAAPARFRLRHDPSHFPDIVITCVDSAAARREIGAQLAGKRSLYYWLDLGNREQDGQVVLGCPIWDEEHRAHYPERLPTVLELFPELMDTRRREDTAPSCSLAEALERQHLFVNQAVVTPALQILWQLFRFGKIDWHGAFVNLKTGRTTPLPVDPSTWARMKGQR
jgi:PRTRC genetic system ThiF family protein